ncbi:phage tail tube protein [Orrella sp. 11846]|uniref:phage tail tube protein n=1 Tax=Orrella sp. 11846 TaxID=3409913 RepID=UPI003B5BE2BB
MSLATQGTHLFFQSDSASDGFFKITCPTGVSGLGGAREQIDDTCLDATDERSYLAGLAAPGTVSIPFNLDPQAVDHHEFFVLKESGEKIQWLVCLSDGEDAPTVDSNGDFDPPSDRTSLEFTAYVADVEIDIATADKVTGTLTLQRSGKVTPYWKGI